MRKKRILIFIVAYNAERTIQKVLERIPSSLLEHDAEILVIDDSSHDQTVRMAREYDRSPFRMTVLFNPVNQGYGGNQKIGFQYAIDQGFDIVALLHGDGQYAPEKLPNLLQPLLNDSADAVFGSRMIRRFDAIKGGMPLYKFFGNRILTTVQNALLGSSLSEFHSGYRIYSVHALTQIRFQLNSNDFHFDTEIIIQLFRAHLRIKEVPIPTYYGNEICHVNGLKYAFNVIKATVLSRAQDLGILYEPKFDSAGPHTGRGHYQAKLSFVSPHTLALERIRSGSSVADIGCAGGYMATALRDKRCQVIGIDQYDVADDVPLHRFIRHDLDRANFPIDLGQFEYVLLLDVIEHLKSPETFVANLRVAATRGEDTSLIVSTANVGFLIPRLMLLFGCFYYGPRGILDLTHTRLFTFATLRRLFEQAGYVVEEIRGIPAPFPLAFGDGAFARLLLDGNRLLIRLWRGLFSYQIFMVVRPLPSLKVLLKRAVESSSASAAVS